MTDMETVLGADAITGRGNSLNPFVLVDDAAGFIDHLTQVFDAEEVAEARTPTPDGKLIHAEVRVGESYLLLADRLDGWPARPGLFQVWVADVADVVRRSTELGGTIVTPPTPFYGAITLARVQDPWGNLWWIYQPTLGQSDPKPSWEGGSDTVFQTLDEHLRANQSEFLKGKKIVGKDLSGARFVASDLSEVVMRAVDVNGADIDAPWLLEGGNSLHVNSVDVVPYVDDTLNQRYRGRAQRQATDPEGLRAAWEVLQEAWSAAIRRVAAMPPGTADVSIDGEWSFAQTLRHLIMATDTWLGRGIEGIEDPFHPIGQPNGEYAADGNDLSVFSTDTPTYAEVREVRAGHVARVRDFLAAVTPDDLAEVRKNPWAPQYPETVLSCVHTILEEEWEHLRFATRDLDIIHGAPTGN